MLQAYSTYALGFVVLLLSVIHYEAFEGARDYDTELAMPSACTELTYKEGALRGTTDDGNAAHNQLATNGASPQMKMTYCQGPYHSHVKLDNPNDCLFVTAGDAQCNGYTRVGRTRGVTLGQPKDKLGEPISGPNKRKHRIVEHLCGSNGINYPGVPAETSCNRAQAMGGWALVLAVLGWVAAIVGMHHAVYQASFILFCFSALALIISWNSVQTMHAETINQVLESENLAGEVFVTHETTQEPALPAVVGTFLAICGLIHVAGFQMNKDKYMKVSQNMM